MNDIAEYRAFKNLIKWIESEETAVITTAQLAKELGINQRAVQNRILRLGLKVERVGNSFVLTKAQAELVRNYKQKQN